MAERLLGFDVGNSCVKGAILGTRPLVAGVAVHQPESQLESWLDRLIEQSGALPAAISTVHPAASDRLVDQLERRGIRPRIVLRSDGQLLKRGLLGHHLETPETTGVDRLLSAIAALERAPGLDVLVVDCGSAITVNWTTAARVFRGGAIFPGHRLMGVALYRGTAALPEVRMGAAPPPLGSSTRAAIASGIYYSLAGGIDRLIEEVTSAANLPSGSFATFLTGGDAEFLAPAIRAPHTLASHLVLEGLEQVALTWEP